MNDDARKQQLALLRKEFEPEHIAKLPKVSCYWCTQANKEKRGTTCNDHRMAKCSGCGNYITTGHIHLDYVGHAEATDRLLDADLEWTWEPLALDARGLPAFDDNDGLWIRLTVAGVTRLGYGSADGKRGPNATKEAIGDAIRNAGMRFGMALNLWAKTDLHADEREAERLAAHQDADAEESQDPWVSEDQLNAIASGLRVLRDVNSANEAAAALARILGREVGAPNQITQAEAEQVLAVLREEDRARAKSEQRAAEAAIAEDVKPKYASGAQLTALKDALAKLGIADRKALLAWCGAKLGRTLGAMKDITIGEYHGLMRELETETAPSDSSPLDRLTAAMRASATPEELAEASELMWTELEAGNLTQAEVSRLQDISLARESELATSGKAAS